MIDQAKRYSIDLFWDEIAWVAQFQPGGPDICSQGRTPEQAILHLAHTTMYEATKAGNLDSVVIRPAE